MSGFDFCEHLFGLNTPSETSVLPHEEIKSFLVESCIRIESRVFDLKLLSWLERVLILTKFYGRSCCARIASNFGGGADYAEEFLIPCQIFHKKINTTVIF